MMNIYAGYIMKLPNEKAFKEQTARGKLISCLLLVKEKDRLKEKGFIYSSFWHLSENNS